MATVGERTRRNVSFVAQWVAILGATLAVLGWAGGFIDRWLDDSIDKRINKQIEDPNTKLGTLNERVTELEKRAGRIFDTWEEVGVGVVRQAKTDGFLMAHSGGSGPNIGRFYLETGESKESLTALSRGGEYEGALIPVRQGHYFKVHLRGGRMETITAFWLPLHSEGN